MKGVCKLRTYLGEEEAEVQEANDDGRRKKMGGSVEYVEETGVEGMSKTGKEN